MKHPSPWLFATLLATCGVAAAQREMSTDRPRATGNPYTVGLGRIQVESTVAGFTRDAMAGNWDVTAYNFLNTNLRLGYTPNTELQIAVDGYLDVSAEHQWSRTKFNNSGFGDTTIRYKRNMRGNAGGGSAYALMPFVKLPTAQEGLGNKKVEGGVTVPYAKELENGWRLGALTQIEMARDNENKGYQPVWFNSVSVGQDFGSKVRGYVELTSKMGEGHHKLAFNAGLTYAVSRNVQLDAGALLGLSRSADDLGLFAGFAKRF